jgi:thiol-disulfide isomerase/thioredoxin
MAASLALFPATGQRANAAAPPFATHFRGQPAPEVPASDADGTRIDIARLRGRVVIINMWATWCTPCRVEMPGLERLAAAFPQDVVVLAISNDQQGWPAIRQFLGNRFPHLRPALIDRADAAERMGILGLPYTIVIDRNGREAARLPRATEWDKGDGANLVASLVARKRSR